MPKLLSEEQVCEYREDGLVFPIPVLSAAEVARARAALDELAAALGGHAEITRLRHLQLFHRWAQELALHPTVLDAVEGVLGPDILVHSSTVFWKPPYNAAYVSWHQDGYYVGLSELSYTSAWLALSDSSADNGCLRVVRGSHRNGIVFHNRAAVSPDNFVSGLEIACQVDEGEATDVTLQPGEMSLHHVAAVHGSNPNTSDRPRIGFAVRYVSPTVRQQLDHYPLILARGQDRFGNYRILEELPHFELNEAIEAQAELQRWVFDSRASSVPISLPASCRLKWKKTHSVDIESLECSS
ncbi:MAG TPA: phytanoyl-CoA dioxygenase family protein [Candidatus Angelobacter sp.]|jgi:ectoine hydroxylase-related dioxygenase (phytanoyl-CoA dioxygenase family)|nr:phytanoyl-CoA dioxygenase family protein [Candidatus Angelobacter sp.]